MVIYEYGYGRQQLPLSAFKQGTGSTRHVEITYARASPSVCVQCRLFSKLMAAPPSYRRFGQWQHIQVFSFHHFSSGPNAEMLDGTSKWASVDCWTGFSSRIQHPLLLSRGVSL